MVPVGVFLVVDVGGVDGHDLGVEAALCPGGGRPLLRGQAERAGVGPGDAPLVGDALGSLELRGELVVAEIGLGDGHAQPQLAVELEPMGTREHELDPAGDGDVDHAGADEAGSHVGGLLRRPALGVDRGGGGGEGSPALSHAVRPMLNACSPTWLTHPVTTWPTSAGRCPSGRRAR